MLINSALGEAANEIALEDQVEHNHGKGDDRDAGHDFGDVREVFSLKLRQSHGQGHEFRT